MFCLSVSSELLMQPVIRLRSAAHGRRLRPWRNLSHCPGLPDRSALINARLLPRESYTYLCHHCFAALFNYCSLTTWRVYFGYWIEIIISTWLFFKKSSLRCLALCLGFDKLRVCWKKHTILIRTFSDVY